jgi:hypothetical protein
MTSDFKIDGLHYEAEGQAVTVFYHVLGGGYKLSGEVTLIFDYKRPLSDLETEVRDHLKRVLNILSNEGQRQTNSDSRR